VPCHPLIRAIYIHTAASLIEATLIWVDALAPLLITHSMSNRDNVNIYSDVVSLFHIEYIGLFNFLTNKLTSRLCSLRSSHYACGLARMFRPRCGLRLGCGPPNLYPASRVAMNGLRRDAENSTSRWGNRRARNPRRLPVSGNLTNYVRN